MCVGIHYKVLRMVPIERWSYNRGVSCVLVDSMCVCVCMCVRVCVCACVCVCMW